jgi:hypothetical protein
MTTVADREVLSQPVGFTLLDIDNVTNRVRITVSETVHIHCQGWIQLNLQSWDATVVWAVEHNAPQVLALNHDFQTSS